MTYATSTPMNVPRKYNTIKMDAPDYLLAILSHYSSKFDGSCLVCLHSIGVQRVMPSFSRTRTARRLSGQGSIPIPASNFLLFRKKKRRALGLPPSMPPAPPCASRSCCLGMAAAAICVDDEAACTAVECARIEKLDPAA